MSPMFLWAFGILKLIEGSSWTNDPNDRGGATILGVSSKSWPDDYAYIMAGKTPEERVARAQCFYWRRYWTRLKLEDIGDRFVALKRFETTVHGETLGNEIEKLVLADLDCESLKEACECGQGEAVFLRWTIRQYESYRDSKQTGFFKGWMRRVMIPLGVKAAAMLEERAGRA